MRQIFILIGLVLIISACSEKKSQIQKILFSDQVWEEGGYSPVENISFEIDNDGIVDTISVFSINNWSDPGDYQEIDIKASSGTLTRMYNLGDWINLEKEQADRFRSINKTKSERFLVADISKDKTLLIIFGYSYASSPGTLTIIDLNKGNPIPILQTEFELQQIEDIDNDGTLEIIGLKYYCEDCCYEDSISTGMTYMPYYVLKFQEDTIVVDVNLSESYNINNYAGFFGLDYDRDNRYLTIHPKTQGDFKPYFYFEKYRKYPQASLRYLTQDDLTGFSSEELRLMRNEIFAFHGYKFDSEDLNDYFSKQDWYKPIDEDVNENLNRFEKENIKLIKELESKQ